MDKPAEPGNESCGTKEHQGYLVTNVQMEGPALRTRPMCSMRSMPLRCDVVAIKTAARATSPALFLN